MNPDQSEPVCTNGMMSTPNTEADADLPKPSSSGTKCNPLFGGGRSRQNLTEVEIRLSLELILQWLLVTDNWNIPLRLKKKRGDYGGYWQIESLLGRQFAVDRYAIFSFSLLLFITLINDLFGFSFIRLLVIENGSIFIFLRVE